MPTSKGFTGQYADAATGLDYYGARYCDPQLGQFTSADTTNDGLNRYGYVAGNPESDSDPTGHRLCVSDSASCGSGQSDLTELQQMELYFLLAITNDYSALSMYLWSRDAWNMAEA